jgi:diguanylate cyclase (GGDEF)-like protein/PAS domain S-box-containing protein
MKLRTRIWLLSSIMILVIVAVDVIVGYRRMEAGIRVNMEREALEVRAMLMATQATYQRQFNASGLPVDEHTLGFLPAHALSRIARDFPHWSASGLRFNNVSDRPRNPANQADANELEAMAWFRANPARKERLQEIRGADGGSLFHYTAPIWTEASCIACHGDPTQAPAAVAREYDEAYGYRVGDLRGLVSIRMPGEEPRRRALGSWLEGLSYRLAGYILMLLVLGTFLNRYVVARLSRLQRNAEQIAAGDYGSRSGIAGDDEVRALADSFDRMAESIQQRDAALKESEERFRMATEHMRDSFILVEGEQGRIIWWNRAAEAVFGYRREEMLGQPLHELLVPPRHRSAMAAALPEFARTGTGGLIGKTVEVTALRKDGQEFPIELSLSAIRLNDGWQAVAVVRDITRRRIEEESERRLKASLRHLTDISAIAALPLADQLRQALTLGAEHLGLEFAIVSQIEGDLYRIQSQVSPPGTLQDGQTFPLGITYCSITLSHGKVLAIADMGHSPYLGHPCYAAFRLEAYIGAPIQVDGKNYGTVNFSSPQPFHRPFDETDSEFVGLLARWVGSAIERDQARQRLVASEARFHQIFETNVAIKLIIDPDSGRIVDANEAACNFYGYDKATLLAMRIGDINTLPAEQIEAELRHAMAGDTGYYNFRHRLASGEVRDVEVYTGPVETDQGRLLHSIIHDVTEQVRAQNALRLAASVFANGYDSIIITDPGNRIVDVNPAFTRITGYSREEVLGRNPRLLSSGRQDAAFYADMWRTLKERDNWRGEIWNRRKNGEIYAELLSISTVRDSQGNLLNYLGVFSDISQYKEHEAELDRIAHYDMLTGVPNRRLLTDRLDQALARARRDKRVLAVCYLDLDGFKPVNDTYGHPAGDHLLVQLTHRLQGVLRAGDTLARLGGDEFVLLFGDFAQAQDCLVVLDRVLAMASIPTLIEGTPVTVSASVGVTLYPIDDADPDTLLRHADQAMYRAKEAGKNRYHLFDPEQDRQVKAHHESLRRLAEALTRREFTLFYQPAVDLVSGEVIGAEALIRWQHPERGLVPPGDFLYLLSGTELEIALGEWVIDSALAQLEAWKAQGLKLRISVNISADHLQRHEFAPRLREALDRHPGVSGSDLELEVLETAAIADMEHTSRNLNACLAMGVRFALDDFGTGYSSLAYFRRLPVDTLKIDQTFVIDMLDDPEDLGIVESVISLARAFNRPVIAEGIESLEHGAMLVHLGCTHGQGFGIARPMPPERLPDWLRTWQRDRPWRDIRAGTMDRQDMVLVVAGASHRRWIEETAAHIEGGARERPHPHSHQCRFGRWYHGRGLVRYGQYPEFQALDPLHEAIHALATELIELAQRDRPAALGRLPELYTQRDRFLAELEKLVVRAESAQAI